MISWFVLIFPKYFFLRYKIIADGFLKEYVNKGNNSGSFRSYKFKKKALFALSNNNCS